MSDLRQAEPDWLEIVRLNWVYVAADEYDTLHAPGQIANAETVDDDWQGDGDTLCGTAGPLFIPGIFSRMGTLRCDRCCELASLPKGKGSPKNDDECRDILGLTNSTA